MKGEMNICKEKPLIKDGKGESGDVRGEEHQEAEANKKRKRGEEQKEEEEGKRGELRGKKKVKVHQYGVENADLGKTEAPALR